MEDTPQDEEDTPKDEKDTPQDVEDTCPKMKAKNPKMIRGPRQLNLLCKNANFKGRAGNLWGGPHGRSPEDVKDTRPGASKGQMEGKKPK